MILIHIVTFILSGRGYFSKQLRGGRHKTLEFREYFLGSLVWLFFGSKIQQNSYSYATTKYMYSTKRICMQQKNTCTQQKK